MLSLQNLLHGNHCNTLGISSNRRENVLASLSPAQKNMLCICLHIGHHTARKSLFETKVSRNWHELLWARKAPLKPRQKKLLVKSSNCSEANWNVAYTVLPQRRVGDPTEPFCMGSMECNLRWQKKLLMEHPNHFSLQHVVSTGWHSPKTLQELMNTLPELLPKIHYLSQKNSSFLTRLEGRQCGVCF